MKKTFNWKLFFLLLGSSLAAGLMVMPFTFALINLPEEIPMGLLVGAQTAQLAVILSVACCTGLLMLRSAGLPGAPALEGWLSGRPVKVHVKEAVLWGLVGGGLTVLLCIPYWDMSIAMMKEEMAVAAWKGVLACFYGGIAEEVLFRLCMMTFFVRLFQKLKLKDAGVWLAIVITGILFGLGHLGITGEMTAVTASVITRAVLLNGSLSVIYGILYWKRGLEEAMIAHFSTDVVLHVLIPHILAPLFV